MTAGLARTHRRAFSDVSDVRPVGDGRFDAEVALEWTIGGRPNGGYLLAMLGRAATWKNAHNHVIAASAHFLRSPDPGPVVIQTEALRAGRSATQVRAQMSQGGHACVEALLTASHLDEATRPYWNAGLPLMSSIGWADCDRVVPILPNGQPVAIMEQIDVRIAPESQGFTRSQPTGQGELRGWLALPGGEAFDPTSLLFAVDAFPPATFDVEFAGWVPTLELTVYVRALPAPGPVRVLHRAQMIEAERVDEVCFVWDSANRLVAQATQLAGIRLV